MASCSSVPTPTIVPGPSRLNQGPGDAPNAPLPAPPGDVDAEEEAGVALVGRLYVMREDSGRPHYIVKIIDEQGKAVLLRADSVEIVTVPEENRTFAETHGLPPWVR